MERYASGNDAAFGEVYDTVAPRLYGYLVRQTRSEAKAQDILQQTLLKMHLARGSFMPGASVMPWAYAIARRLVIDGVRRGRREVPLDPEDAAQAPADPATAPPGADELVAAGQLARRLAQELAKLPEGQRVAFELIKQEELSVAEAAEVLGTTVSAVKLRAHRAYLALREAMGDLAGTPPGEKKEVA